VQFEKKVEITGNNVNITGETTSKKILENIYSKFNQDSSK